MILGAHVPISGGLDKAADTGKLLGCEAIQIFTSNPKGWDFSVRSEAEINRFKAKVKSGGIKKVFGHSIYLVNIASSNPYIYTNSINSLISGMVLAQKADFDGVVIHVGSHKGKGYETGIKQIVNALKQIIGTVGEKTPILLETDAGSGDRVGCKFEDLQDIISRVKSKCLGVCLDTCHIFASGYDVKTEKGLEKTIKDFDRIIGLEKLALIHLNDSKGELGSNLDRHEIIGEGEIGLDAFRRIINHPELKHLPGIVETPDRRTFADENISLKRLKDIREE